MIPKRAEELIAPMHVKNNRKVLEGFLKNLIEAIEKITGWAREINPFMDQFSTPKSYISADSYPTLKDQELRCHVSWSLPTNILR